MSTSDPLHSSPGAQPGAAWDGDEVVFRCWAPLHQDLNLLLLKGPNAQLRAGSTVDRGALPAGATLLEMKRLDDGSFEARSPASSELRYAYVVDGKLFPDPASKWQPEGVHGLSALPETGFSWTDAAFAPTPAADLVLYELHVGSFTPQGTLDAAADRLQELADTGITGVELMPVAQFPGKWNWGYDGVYPWAVQDSYGGPDAMKRFVDRAHSIGISVLLDVVFNHLGPEGNYSRQFGPYFTDHYGTPWGEALNFDGPGSDGVRRFFLGAVRYWLEEYHLDGFRLDAVHEIYDQSATPFLREVGEVVRSVGERTGQQRIVIAESDLNDRRLVEPVADNGIGLDAAWSDDFHHSMHVQLTGESQGYYADYQNPDHLARSLANGWSYAWDYAPSRNRHHGSSPDGLAPERFVFCTQNHDQVGNRMLGERLRTLAGASADRVARAVLLLAPAVPLLFMGQEYGEQRPFLYFVDHGDPGLLLATREGRAREFSAFHSGKPPDPGDPSTRSRSVLDWDQRHASDELALTCALLRLRRRTRCFGCSAAVRPVHAIARDGAMMMVRSASDGTGLVVANLSRDHVSIDLRSLADENDVPAGELVLRLSLGTVHGGRPAGTSIDLGPLSAAVYTAGYPAEEPLVFPN